MSIPFDTIASSLLSRAESLLPEWFPAGKREGTEYRIGNLRGDAGKSLSINLNTGVWKDFGGGPDDAGADLISLYAAIHGLSQADAARHLAPHLANGHDRAANVVQRTASPPPAAARPEPPSAPGAAALYRYTDQFYIARFEKPDGSKVFTPFTHDGTAWQRKAHAKPRPLYGLDALAARADAPVLVVEGEKTAHAAAEALAAYVVMTWAGGAQAIGTADWTPLHGRTVDIWPDADEPGRKAGADIAGLLLPHCPRVRMVDTTDAPSEGWDVADAVADGMTAAQVLEWGRARIKPVDMPAEQPASVPRGTSRKPKAPKDDGTLDQPAYVLWEQLQLARNDRGPYATEANALRILAGHTSYADRIWLDEFSQRLMIDATEDDLPARQFAKSDAVQILIWMQDSLQLQKMPLSAVERAAQVVGERNKRHPVKRWLESLAWDGTLRLADFLSLAFGAEANAYSAAVGRCWLVGMVARIYEPGCKFDTVPVFEGPQGIRKSSALSALGGAWFMESNRNPVRDPDRFSQSLQGKWLVEIPEIDRVGGRHGSLDDLTGMITIRTDTYRMPYAPTFMDYPRQCVFAGTLNPVAGWQPDVTGGRRFWPVVCDQINIDWLTENREQLFAEALARYRDHECYWDVPEAEAKAEQEARRMTDGWEEIILRYIGEHPDRRGAAQGLPLEWFPRAEPLEKVTVMQILTDALNMPENKCDQGAQNRVARCLIALGWRKYRARLGQIRTNEYRKD